MVRFKGRVGVFEGNRGGSRVCLGGAAYRMRQAAQEALWYETIGSSRVGIRCREFALQ